jgi:uncharacterized protein
VHHSNAPALVIGSVARLATAPVKGMALVLREAVDVGPAGIAGDRRLAVVDEDDRLVNGKRLGPLATIAAEVHAAEAIDAPERLRLRLPDGTTVEDEVVTGSPVAALFFGRARAAHAVAGPFSDALSAWAGAPVRLVRLDEPGNGVDRADLGAGFTLVSRGSLRELAAAAGLDEPLDPRRFRMSAVVDGVEAYAEDGWIGRRVRVGEAVVEPQGNVGRCAVTTHDPATGRRNLDTLALLARTRGDVETTEPLPFGVWARIVAPGRVRVGDPVALLADEAGDRA